MSLNSKYYDQPEGKDLSGKMIATNKAALTGGLIWSIYDVVLFSKPQGYLPTIGRIASITGPFMGIATAFTLGTYTATNVRGKDDTINYVIGGYCAGAVYGAWKRNLAAGIATGTFFALLGLTKKLSIMEGWDLFPEQKGRGWISLHEHDFTLMRDPAKNWTTGKEQ
ncbi:unnamed protein product [Hermetia illucens]|uniref:NADH dehydrogenase [ubiquinone] 1 alpha subcomplex subunit 11 n=1 Tax=Hermetia illucens TaxID=343691 RepID=A0A7R8U9T9_HERIL|nr:uncharacterized protein LOC119658684 [Hermetia illucens]CAD7076825.1 unnamed protein product [Hermetia illucens]